MAAKLDKDSERPSRSPEGLLRALGVATPAAGIDWGPGAQLVVTGDDVVSSQPFVALPEDGYGALVSAAVVAEFSALQVMSSRRGCWCVLPDSASISRILRFDSAEQAAIVSPLLLPLVAARTYSINGGCEVSVQTGTIAVSQGVLVTMTAITADSLNSNPGRIGLWLPPGAVVQFANTVANTAVTFELIVREPLGPP